MNKLLFFNENGYPYNFEYNSKLNKYSGKILFDENSDGLYKIKPIYIFEEVEPISFNKNLDLIKFELYDTSGISFINGNNINNIDNITNVNTSPDFYSKWIYGKNFDTLYPKGSVISFSALTFQNIEIDFNHKYYTVIDNKPNAILINTDTNNENWDNIFLSGIIISNNIIKFPDFDNSLTTYINSATLYNNKKLSISNSKNNDSIKSFKDYDIKNIPYQFYDTSGDTDDELKINITLYTERPKIYQGNANFELSGNTAHIKFNNNYNIKILKKGDEIIFEDYNDNSIIPSNPTFTIIGEISKIDLYSNKMSFVKELNINKTYLKHFNNYNKSSQDFVKYSSPETFKQYIDYFLDTYPPNFFEYEYYIDVYNSGETIENLNIDDIISLSALTSGNTLNTKREFKIFDIIPFYKTRILYWIEQISLNNTWLKKVKNDAILNNKSLEQQIEIEAINLYNDYDNNPESEKYINIENRYIRLRTEEYIIPEDNVYYIISKKLHDYQLDTIICNYSPTVTYSAFTENIIGYKTSNILNLTQNIISESGSTIPDYKTTIELLNIKYKDILDEYGIKIYYKNNKINIQSIYSINNNKYYDTILYINNNSAITETSGTTGIINSVLLKVDEKLNNECICPDDFNNFATNYNAIIIFDLVNNNNNYGFTLYINDNEYYIPFDTDTQTTVLNFKLKYYTILLNKGIKINNSGNTLYIDGLYPNIDIILDIKVNIFSKYDKNENKNKGIFISGNIIKSNDNIFFDYGLSTGMIITVSGSTYPLNNKEYNIIGLYENIIELSYQGVFFKEIDIDLNILTKTFLRKPRDSYKKDIYYNFKFSEPYSNKFFFMDITGNHLQPYLNDTRLEYKGVKPLWDSIYDCTGEQLILIDKPNEKIEYIYNPKKQQTIFRGENGEYCLKFLLDEYDSKSEYNYIPEPLQIFPVYNSTEEGYHDTIIKMDKVEYILLSGFTNDNFNFILSNTGILKVISSNIFNFNNLNFEIGQHIKLDFKDENIIDNITFNNYGIFEIITLNDKEMKLKSLKENYIFTEFYTSASTFLYNIEVQPKNILELHVFGETEIEDIRYDMNLKYVGVRLNKNIEKIFPESDINEEGIDYKLLNRKRKEMLSVFKDIYNYTGSYKAIINSINFFGWNELELYEYYKNINPKSELYQKLQKVLIPDIFDNTVKGWSNQNYLKNKYDTGNYKKTNLFNLTYNITDETGENILLYSLDDIQIKLNKLKNWLRRNVIPLSSNLIDITGVAKTNTKMYQKHISSYFINKHYSSDTTDVINFLFSKTLNFDTDYLFEIKFYTINSDINLSGWTCKIQTFSMENNNKLIPQKYFKLMKNNLHPYSFNIDINTDEYIYIETLYYNDRGVGLKYNKLINTSTFKNYLLINNNFNIPSNYKYLSLENDTYYYFDEYGYIYIK